MLRTFEAIKRSSFFNEIFNFCPISEKASAEIRADAQQMTNFVPIISRIMRGNSHNNTKEAYK